MLADYGKKVIERREKFIEEINGIIASVHQKLTDGKEQLSLSYEKSNGETELFDAIVRTGIGISA